MKAALRSLLYLPLLLLAYGCDVLGIPTEEDTQTATVVGTLTASLLDSIVAEGDVYRFESGALSNFVGTALWLEGDQGYFVGQEGEFVYGSINDTVLIATSVDPGIIFKDIKIMGGTIFIVGGSFLYRSTDGGASFEKLEYSNISFQRLLIDEDTQQLTVITEDWTYVSDDAGNTFVPISTGRQPFESPGTPAQIYQNPTTGDIFVAGFEDIYQSTNGGESFSRLTPAPPFTDVYSVYQAADGSVWVANSNYSLARSPAPGEGWTTYMLSGLDALAVWPRSYALRDGVMWIAVGNGNSGLVKAQFDGVFITAEFSFTAGSGVNSDLAFDENGSLWIASSNAISKNAQALIP